METFSATFPKLNLIFLNHIKHHNIFIHIINTGEGMGFYFILFFFFTKNFRQDYTCKNNEFIFIFQEYETLTNKIHELQVKEEDLLAKMPNEEDRSPTCSLPASTSGGGAQPNISNSIPSPKPVHGIIKAYLPNEQFSLVWFFEPRVPTVDTKFNVRNLYPQKIARCTSRLNFLDIC